MGLIQMDMKRSSNDPLFSAVREVLLSEWDPIGIGTNENCSDEYDSYVSTVCQMLRQGVDDFRLTRLLTRFQSDSMGLTVVDENLNQRVARKLIGLLKE
jgi:hypothetical protein